VKTSKQRSNSKGLDKLYLSWDEYDILVETLCEKIRESNMKLCGVWGIPRGGTLLAVMVSHILNIKYLANMPSKNTRKKVLIVDDLSDTGCTFRKVIMAGNKKSRDMDCIKPNICTAAIFKHKDSSFSPDFYVRENNVWIDFPYERD